MKKMTLWERALGQLAGKTLVILAKQANKRGDTHEFHHLLAAVLVGNSNHTGRWNLCRNAEVIALVGGGGNAVQGS